MLDGKADLSYELAVEVMPDFEPVDVATLEPDAPGLRADRRRGRRRRWPNSPSQNRTYEPRPARTAKAKDGDMVVIDFVGRIDGDAFEGGSGEDAEIVIGSGRFIPGFEEQLIGAKPGDLVTVKVTFPDDYPAETLKGKAAEFEVTVKEVQAPAEAAADDAFAERLGLPDLAGAEGRGEVAARRSSTLGVALQAQARPARRARQRSTTSRCRRAWSRASSRPSGSQVEADRERRRAVRRGQGQDRRRSSRPSTARSPSAACAWAWCWPRSAALNDVTVSDRS